MRFALHACLSLALAVTCVSAISTGDSVPDLDQNAVVNRTIIPDGVDMSDPEARRKVRLLQERIEAAARADQERVSPDLTDETIERLVYLTIIADDPRTLEECFEELSRRPGELIPYVENYVKNPSLQLHQIDRIIRTSLAAGRDFQNKIAKQLLFHPSASSYDFTLLGYDHGLPLMILARAATDETEVIDRLVEEGRIEKGSELESSWRMEFAKHRSSEERSILRRPDRRRAGEDGDSQNTSRSESRSKGVTLLIGVIFAALVSVSVIWIRMKLRHA